MRNPRFPGGFPYFHSRHYFDARIQSRPQIVKICRQINLIGFVVKKREGGRARLTRTVQRTESCYSNYYTLVVRSNLFVGEKF